MSHTKLLAVAHTRRELTARLRRVRTHLAVGGRAPHLDVREGARGEEHDAEAERDGWPHIATTVNERPSEKFGGRL